MLTPPSAIAKLEQLLDDIGSLNNGCDHSCEYAMYRLPEAATVCMSLDRYFAAYHNSNTLPQPAEHWFIQTAPLGADWEREVRSGLMHWFFEQEYSPPMDAASQQALVDQALACIHEACGTPQVFEVTVSPPMWYDCLWQDFAFTSPAGNWLLHLGLSD